MRTPRLSASLLTACAVFVCAGAALAAPHQFFAAPHSYFAAHFDRWDMGH